MRKLRADMMESTESTSASSLSLLRQLLDQVLPFASSPIDVLFPSFGIYGVVVPTRLQSSLELIFWTESRCAQPQSLSLAQLISLI
jgi:hypothetical protein